MSRNNAVSHVTVYTTECGTDVYIGRGKIPSAVRTRLYVNPSRKLIGKLNQAVSDMTITDSIKLIPWLGFSVGWTGFVQEKGED